MNLKAISKNVGLALLVTSLFMFISVCISVYDGMDSGFVPLAVGTLVTFIVGIFPFIFVKGNNNISLKDGFVIIVLSWFLAFLFGMLPYVMWGGEMSIVDAWFESVSGFTTTGATILNDIEALPRSLLFWRSSTHFIGGLGVVVFILLVVPSASPFRKRITKIEMSSLSKEGFQLQNRKLVTVITSVYLGIFVTSTLTLWACGMNFFDAINHGFSVCATGGFSTKNASVAYFDSPLINVVMIFFMILATTNFALIFTCVARRSLRPVVGNSLVRFYLGSILVMSLIVVFSLKFQWHEEIGWSKALLDGFSTTVSYVTTTGFCFADNRDWPFLACGVLVYASIQCAMAGSTSSGIKVDRMLVVFRGVKRQIKSNLHPNNTSNISLGGMFLPDSTVLPIVLYIVLYLIIALLSSGLLLVCGVNGVEAVSGSIACLSNVGPGLAEVSLAGNYDMIPMFGKIVLTLDMFLGRLEIYPILVAFSLLFTKER